jgi:hypothetical protein
MARIQQTPYIDGQPAIRAQLTGRSGARKSFCATHLPNGQPSWDGKILYVASELTSQSLESTHPEDRDRMIVLVPDGFAENKDGHIITDWLGEYNSLTQTHFKSEYPDICALVWDSGTETTRKLLVENMRMNYFHDKKPTTGLKNDKDPRFRLTKEERTAIGDKGDYRMVHEGFLEGLTWLMALNRDIHIIFTFQECIGDGEPGSREKIFGPSMMGAKGPRRIPHFFGVSLHNSVSDGTDGGKEGQTRVLYRDHGNYLANLKSSKPHPPHNFLDFDREQVRKMWLDIQGYKAT